MKYLLTSGKKVFFKFSLSMKLTILFIMFFIMQALTYCFGQQATVTGKATGEGDKPLSGVSVQVKGTTKGTTTNAQGASSISASNNDVLGFSYVGYEPQEIAAANKTELNVSLVAAKTNLEQVVVIGYGTANKRDLTGSIAKVSGKEVADKPNSNPVASLQGKVSGLYV